MKPLDRRDLKQSSRQLAQGRARGQDPRLAVMRVDASRGPTLAGPHGVQPSARMPGSPCQ